VKNQKGREMKKPLNLIAVIALAAIVMFTVASCDKEPTDLRPELPPVESLVMDFSDFASPPAGMKSSEPTYVNFVLAYTTVSYWNATAVLVSALPVAAYVHMLSQTPDYLGENTWEWSYEFQFNAQSFKATLTGKRLNNEEFSMEMVISHSSMSEEGVLWFDGVARYDHTSADWTLYKDGSIEVLEIAWNKDFETEEADLTYTYVEPDQEETGSHIMWAYLPGEDYDSKYEISMAESMTNIEWNVSTIKGRIKSLAYYENEEWNCWDSYANGLVDILCE
jgi:hypothetical protein